MNLEGPIGLVGSQSVLLHILILVFTAWRITSLLVDEEGPFEIFHKLRHFIGVRKVEGSDVAYGTNVIAEGFSCIWCASFWVGIGLTIFYLIAPSLTVLLSLPFALSAGVILLEKIINGNF